MSKKIRIFCAKFFRPFLRETEKRAQARWFSHAMLERRCWIARRAAEPLRRASSLRKVSNTLELYRGIVTCLTCILHTRLSANGWRLRVMKLWLTHANVNKSQKQPSWSEPNRTETVGNPKREPKLHTALPTIGSKRKNYRGITFYTSILNNVDYRDWVIS